MKQFSHDDPRFLEVLAALFEMTGQAQSVIKNRIFYEALSGYSIEEIQQATMKFFTSTEKKFGPVTPGDLIRHIVPTAEEASLVAWRKAVRAIGLAGSYNSVVFDDSAIHFCIDQMGGWVRFCQMTEEEQPFRAKDFQRLYYAAVRTGKYDYPRMMLGLSDADNVAKGVSIPPQPMTIGDYDKSLVVYKGGLRPGDRKGPIPLELKALLDGNSSEDMAGASCGMVVCHG